MLGAAALTPPLAAAESTILLESPGELENVAATTYDKDGQAVGISSFEIETLDDGRRHMKIAMSIEGGAHNVSEAFLEPIPIGLAGDPDETSGLRPIGPRRLFRVLEERSQATRADGGALSFLVIDHEKGRVSCYPPDRDRTKGTHLEITGADRVVNVPMQLLFQPLVSGQVDHLRFQIATCKNGPVLHRIVAVRGPIEDRGGRRVVEIRYGPDLGDAMAWFASRLLPRFSFWFDRRDGSYLGHRMPLHRKGPSVLLVREGLAPSDLGFHDLD